MFKKSNIKYDINKLQDWFKTLRDQFGDREFDPIKHIDFVEDEYKPMILKNPENFKHTGFALETNLSDEYPQTMFRANHSKYGFVDYHRTPMVFGYIEEIMKDFPNAIFWSVSCQHPGAKLKWHTDKHNEAAIWIPIQVDNTVDCFSLKDKENTIFSYPLTADGSVYYVDNSLSHTTFNNSETERSMIVAYFNVESTEGKELLSKLLN
jgi:uncharacterized RmlC-like cupin family protein